MVKIRSSGKSSNYSCKIAVATEKGYWVEKRQRLAGPTWEPPLYGHRPTPVFVWLANLTVSALSAEDKQQGVLFAGLSADTSISANCRLLFLIPNISWKKTQTKTAHNFWIFCFTFSALTTSSPSWPLAQLSLFFSLSPYHSSRHFNPKFIPQKIRKNKIKIIISPRRKKNTSQHPY